MITRRRLLLSSLASTVATVLPRAATASTGAKRFFFVWNDGGWDPLCLFAPLFDSQTIEFESGVDTMTFSDLTLVDHASRPLTRAFFEAHAFQASVVNGISVPSVSHDICALLAMTGGTGGDRPDWPTRIANLDATTWALPSVVVSGPSYTAELGAISSRVGMNGQLQGLLDGTSLTVGDGLAAHPLGAGARARVDDLVARAAAREAATGDPLSIDLADSLSRATTLEATADSVDLGGFTDFPSQLSVGVQALAAGIARCVTVSSGSYKLYWDSHASNDAIQTPNFELLFGGLAGLVALLETTAAPEGGVLSDSTVVVVLSEMGRTPQYNESDGRDHWPFTSALLFGAGIPGGQAVSGYDDGLHGVGYDPTSGQVIDDLDPLTPEHLGATLLALAGADPEESLPGIAPIAALLP